MLINDVIALDAGSLSQGLPIERQVKVGTILLTHSHIDHTSSIPFFIDNVFGRRDAPLDVYTSGATIYSIRKYLFNNATWPDFTRLPNHLEPVITFHELQHEIPVDVHGVRFTPIPVNHPVPTHGFLIEQDGQAILWSSDTGPTRRLWEIANQTRNLRAICIDTSFNNALQDIADVSGHLTPATLARELGKLENQVPILLHHLKPACIDAIREEVGRLGRPDIGFLEQGRIYEF
jgi:ribonuclease BN (tRNA processing enzyme)